MERSENKQLTMTVEEAAKALGIGRGLAYDLVGRGELPSVRLGRRLVVPREALGRLLSDSSVGRVPRGSESHPSDDDSTSVEVSFSA